MIKLYCFSATGRSGKVAEYLAQKLNLSITDIDPRDFRDSEPSNTAIVVFPVYCQNIPAPVKAVLPKIKAENFVLIATYGKKSFGNVISDAYKLICGRVIAAAYFPIGHTYLNEQNNNDYSLLDPVLNRISNPKTIKIPKSPKNPFADFLPRFRSRVGVKIKATTNCNRCNLCAEKCVMDAIKKGKINGNCIRCLRCVGLCPNRALRVKYNPFLTLYLKYKNNNRIKIYL